MDISHPDAMNNAGMVAVAAVLADPDGAMPMFAGNKVLIMLIIINLNLDQKHPGEKIR